MRLRNCADFRSFLETKPGAAIHFGTAWNVAVGLNLQQRMLGAEAALAGLANPGEVDCGSDPAREKSIPVPNVPLVAYYRYGELIAALVGAEQNVGARMARVFRGESIGYNDQLSSVQLSEPTRESESLRTKFNPH
jgi:hypothetical protein